MPLSKGARKNIERIALLFAHHFECGLKIAYRHNRKAQESNIQRLGGCLGIPEFQFMIVSFVVEHRDTTHLGKQAPKQAKPFAHKVSRYTCKSCRVPTRT